MTFEKHVLEVVFESDVVSVYSLEVPGTIMGSVQLTFSPAGTAIQGDYTPSHNGVCSNSGRYGLGWFSQKHGDDYLCEKFLRKAWQPDVAYASIRAALDGDEGEFLYEEISTDDELRERLEDLLRYTSSPSDYECCEILDGIDEWYEVGLAYNTRDREALAAIHEAFRTRYEALQLERARARPRCICRCGYTCRDETGRRCGSPECMAEHWARDCGHVFDGPAVPVPYEGVEGTTSTCRHCGYTEFSHGLASGP